MAFSDRQSIRLAAWDYRWAGWYFVTVCTHERRRLLARVVGGRMRLTWAGRRVSNAWHTLPDHFDSIQVDAFVVMPDHVHGIIRIVMTQPGAPDRVGCSGPPPGSLGAAIGAFKAAASKAIRMQRPDIGRLWQRNYFERILRNEEALIAVRKYIVNNPAAWIRRYGDDAPTTASINANRGMST